MKKSIYMASNEMKEFMWLSAVVQIFEGILKTTTDKVWIRKIKTCRTLILQIIDDRIAYLSEVEKPKVARRVKQIGIKVYSYDDARVDKDDENRKVTISSEDFLDLCAAAFQQCKTCKQGELVKDCPRRKMYHRLGLQVYACRENPKPGECEFRNDNEQRAVTPQCENIETDIIEQLP